MKFVYDVYSEAFYCSELNVKSYKNLLKSLYGETPDPNVFLEEFIQTFVSVSDKPKSYFEQLSYEQLFLLLLQLRINTFGSECKIVISKNSDKEKAETQNIFLNLESIKNDILNALEFVCEPITFNGIQIYLKPPSLNRLRQYTTEPNLNCVHSCAILSQNSMLNVTTNEEAKQLFDIISPKMFAEATNKWEKYTHFLSETNFLSFIENNKYFLGFNQPFSESLVWYAKLFFSENMSTLYENIFYLAKYANITPSYLEEECTPGEYIFYVKKLSAMLEEKNAQNLVE